MQKMTLLTVGGEYSRVRTKIRRGSAMKNRSGFFPHELCQLVFLEQLYRAMQTKKGSGYHH